MTVVLAVSALLLLLVAMTLGARALFGPDPDLAGPWDPEDPDRYAPFSTCGRRSVSRPCRVDHATVGQWKTRAPR